MEDYKTPGQDLFEALRDELRASPSTDAAHMATTALQLRPMLPLPEWSGLSAHAKAIFGAAAARFLSE